MCDQWPSCKSRSRRCDSCRYDDQSLLPQPTSLARLIAVNELTDYAKLLADIKSRIQAAQTRAVLAVNAEMIRLYWGIGRLIDERQGREGWGNLQA